MIFNRYPTSDSSRFRSVATKRVKDVATVLGLTLSSAGAILLLAIGAAVVVAIGTGSTPNDAFHQTKIIPESLAGQVEWLPSQAELPRPLEPATRQALEGTWVRAFAGLELVSLGQYENVDLETWFAGRALDAVLDSQQHNPTATILSQASHHQVQMHFYSADGQIAALSSTTTIVRRIGDKPIEFVEQYQAVLILADGNWRIEQLVRTGAEPQR